MCEVGDRGSLLRNESLMGVIAFVRSGGKANVFVKVGGVIPAVE